MLCKLLYTGDIKVGDGGYTQMKGLYDVARHLVWLTQFGLSVVVPPTLCIAGSVWLRRRFALGGWVIAVGIVVGLLAAASCLRSSLQALERQGRTQETHDQKPPISFNQH